MAINEEKLNQLLGSCITDFGATVHAGLVVIGESLGLYKAMDNRLNTSKMSSPNPPPKK